MGQDKETQPAPGLGANFEQAPRATLQLSTKAQVWGDRSGTAWEPAGETWQAMGGRGQVLQQLGSRCAFCGLPTQRLQVHSRDDLHLRVDLDNLAAADALCHGWHHLGELAAGDGYLVYLPGLSPQDVNHLQRTLLIALASDDAELRADAEALMTWLVTHRDYVKRGWGTYEPAPFAQAITRLNQVEGDPREDVFAGLAVVFHPELMQEETRQWSRELQVRHPLSQWKQVYHAVMHSPA